jgi:hypothetical protein
MQFARSDGPDKTITKHSGFHLRRANSIAAISAQSSGTQTSFPEAKDLPSGLTH